MKYTLIKGTFHVVGYSPDGDSMMFKAMNAALWDRLGTDDNRALFEVKLKDSKNHGAVQLRLQGIDALETHYRPEALPPPSELKGKAVGSKPSPEFDQPTGIGVQAAEAFMNFMGVKKVEWRNVFTGSMVQQACLVSKDGKAEWIKEQQADMIPGYIVAADIEKNGRPLAWVFAGRSGDRDGASLSQDQLMARVDQSANYYLLQQGLVYPYFFMTLAGGLREKMAEAAKLAQKAAAKLLPAARALSSKASNIWAYDKSALGVKIPTVKKIAEEIVIYPYLFRKVIKSWYQQKMQQYWDALLGGRDFTFDLTDTSLDLEHLFVDGNPRVFVVSGQDFVRLDEVIEVKSSSLRMKKQPSDIVFLS